MHTYYFAEIQIGQKASFQRTITAEMETAFRMISGDENPLHQDDAFAREVSKGAFAGHAAFGMLTASLYSTMAGMYLPGTYSLIHSFQELSFLKPVFVGDVLNVEGEVVDKVESLNLICLKVTIRNQQNQRVSRARMKVLVLK